MASRSGEESRERAASQLARTIVTEIIDMGWPVGRLLGSETELMQRYHVSRSIVRQVTQMLDHWQVATMRTGRHGGLVVIAPDPSAVVYSAALNLRFNGVLAHELYESRKLLEVANVELAIARVDDDAEKQLRQIIEGGERRPDLAFDDRKRHAIDLHVFLIELGGLRPLQLFNYMLVDLAREHDRHASLDESSMEEIRRAHVLIAEAVLDRDVELAKRRLAEHLDAAAAWLQHQHAQLRLPGT